MIVWLFTEKFMKNKRIVLDYKHIAMHNEQEIALQAFIDKHVSIVADKYKQTALAYFTATTSGKEEDYKISADAQFDLERIYTNTEDFARITAFVQDKDIHDELLKRQLEMLFLSYQPRQIDEAMLEKQIELQNHIEKTFFTFRAEINGEAVTDNQIKKILNSSDNSDQAKEAWLAGKKVGSLVAEDLIRLVKMRNDVARSLGYDNYHAMSLHLDEQDPKEINTLFAELDELTRDTFIQEKKHIDSYLANKFHITENGLMPWHYQDSFFQEAPKVYPVHLDTYYQDQDIVQLSSTYYASMGLVVDDMLAKSDLYEREGKYQHAYCINVDKLGDVRIVCNIKPDSKWMNTQLHELWHAVYDKYLDPAMPYLLRDPAHTFTTEAIAMLFGRFATNPQWIQDMIGIDDNEKQQITHDCFATLRLEQLVFSRWAQVMYHFEKSLYENPEQDLNALWRDIVEKYQMIKRPVGRDMPDWATKIHIASSPCYYHNYLLGELLASQLYSYIIEQVLHSSEYVFQSFYNKPEVGTYLKEKIFAAGRMYHRNTMIEKATGEKLTAKYYAKQFVQ